MGVVVVGVVVVVVTVAVVVVRAAVVGTAVAVACCVVVAAGTEVDCPAFRRAGELGGVAATDVGGAMVAAAVSSTMAVASGVRFERTDAELLGAADVGVESATMSASVAWSAVTQLRINVSRSLATPVTSLCRYLAAHSTWARLGALQLVSPPPCGGPSTMTAATNVPAAPARNNFWRSVRPLNHIFIVRGGLALSGGR